MFGDIIYNRVFGSLFSTLSAVFSVFLFATFSSTFIPTIQFRLTGYYSKLSLCAILTMIVSSFSSRSSMQFFDVSELLIGNGGYSLS